MRWRMKKKMTRCIWCGYDIYPSWLAATTWLGKPIHRLCLQQLLRAFKKHYKVSLEELEKRQEVIE